MLEVGRAGKKYYHSCPIPQFPYIFLLLDLQGVAFLLLPISWWQVDHSTFSLIATVQIGKGEGSNREEGMDGPQIRKTKLSQKSQRKSCCLELYPMVTLSCKGDELYSFCLTP